MYSVTSSSIGGFGQLLESLAEFQELGPRTTDCLSQTWQMITTCVTRRYMVLPMHTSDIGALLVGSVRWTFEFLQTLQYTISEVFTAVKIQFEVFWVVAPRSDVVGNQRFGEPCFFHLQREVVYSKFPRLTYITEHPRQMSFKIEGVHSKLLLKNRRPTGGTEAESWQL